MSDVRKDHGDTQADLAKRLGVSLPTVRSWEQERSAPSHEMLIQICQLYSVSSDYLLGLSDADPLYHRAMRAEMFTAEELAALDNFEKFLLWKRNRK